MLTILFDNIKVEVSNQNVESRIKNMILRMTKDQRKTEKGRQNTVWSEEEKQIALEGRKLGKSVHQIAEILERTYGAVYMFFNQHDKREKKEKEAAAVEQPVTLHI